MKKTYIQPEMLAIDLEMKTMLCQSATMSSDSQDNGVALSRGFDFTDDEFDE